MKIVVHTDGGARGNPGPSAIGVVIHTQVGVRSEPQVLLAEFGKRIGETTNNVAEYTAVIEALRFLEKHVASQGQSDLSEVCFYLDSLLVVNQLNGVFRVKDAKMRELLIAVRLLESSLPAPVTYTAIPREENVRADLLVNKALDS